MSIWLVKKNGDKVKPGDVITDFRGNDWGFLSLTSANTKVYAEKLTDRSWKQEFYPSVFNCDVKNLSSE